MIWLIGILLVANLALFLMPHKETRVNHVYEEQASLNSDLLSLLNEEEESSTTGLGASSDIQPVEVQAKPTKVCYRVGPFLQVDGMGLAKAILDNASIQYYESKRESRRASVYRVFLGPWFDRNQLQASKQKLTENKISDYFEKKQKEGSWIISLGIYLNQVSAESELQRFRNRGLLANIRNEQQQLPTNYWLNLDINQEKTSLIKDLSSMDWGSYTAKFVVTSCS